MNSFDGRSNRVMEAGSGTRYSRMSINLCWSIVTPLSRRIRNGLCWFFIEPEKEPIVDREGLCPLQKPKEIWITCLYSFHLKLISEMNTYCFPLGVHFTGYTPENKEAIMKPS
ncbi:hypothetical protein CAPTEDRAFT_209446 [Capitella teleta]|uniref:Uncharacterized protein n=1 Tax=Capitella teleta TaxID=283909 RepID=R7UVM8_CAPTE|nr:hypothetical protein CAPTEDRAFT_209446 [Capitella teleta]|eukprot:ELU07446.1 hypothetical protein CAPTEDRAFT_209446 [Capitella teleta]